MLDSRLADRLIDALMRVPGADERATRTALLPRIPVSLNRVDNPLIDFNRIIAQLDNLGRLDNGERPVVILAHNAARMVRGTELGRELEAIERDVEKSYGQEEPMADLPVNEEGLIFGGPGEWVTSTFLDQAALVAKRVARLRVPRYVGREFKRSVGSLGTGWLIAPGLLLTNHHVVNARERGEPAASSEDFTLQGKNTVAWFDYLVEGRETIDIAVVEMVASNRDLDYALLRLSPEAEPSQRAALAVPQSTPDLDRGTRLNIVQCPDGGALKFAIRNNFYASRGTKPFRIRYLTDTKPGSSGAPVMDDNWQAVALHQGFVEVDPKRVRTESGSSEVAKFLNQGIAIEGILQDLPAEVAGEIKKAQGWKGA